ncbi:MULTISPECIES: SRPBCC family protein [unclassified Iodidimonas]|jgi:uncharacterized protein YndB with AHSA1/START domain|uniref:SRPBCC family protein n=1 Tax=unclassified Iodidimonas TaxID=2626145 RepID=UPI002482C45E|nr:MULTISPECIES: SRPBCC family protein [unclassified Iodidimonas]
MHKKEPWEWAILGGLALAGLLILGFFTHAYLKSQWVIEIALDLPAPPEAAFHLLSDPESRVAWQFGVTDIAPLTGEGHAIGATRMIYLRVDGKPRQISETQRVYDRPRLWAVVQEAADAEIEVRAQLQPAPLGSHLIWRETWRYQTPMARFLAPFETGTRKAQIERALDRLADRAAKTEGQGD